LVVFGGFAVMLVLLRWTFSSGHSLIQRQPRQGEPSEYGLLVSVATPATFIEGERLRLTLLESNIRGTLVTTTHGPRLMVFPQDASVARAILETPRPGPEDPPRP
jgi:FtsP/CotA-like multicopper oxidase with cupredoxin domain